MKQYINYVVLSLLSTVALFSACNMEDPEIPMVNYRYATSEKEITNFPDGISSGYELSDRFFFGINNSLYFSGNCYETPDGKKPYENTVLYQYDTNTGKWEIVWYISEEEIRELQESEHFSDEAREKLERLRRMVDIVRGNNFNQGNICTYNGKGYIFTDEMIMEFTPSTNKFTVLSYGPSYYNPIRWVFSTTKGIFGINYNGSSELYQYSPQTHWRRVGDIPYELLNYVNSNSLQLFSQQEKLYTWGNYDNYQYSIQQYSFPYTTMDKYNVVTCPHDYGWENSHYYYISPYTPESQLFCINGKIYKANNSSGISAFYEYDPVSNGLSLVLLKNNYSDSYNNTLLSVVGNKLYFLMNNQSLFEITF